MESTHNRRLSLRNIYVEYCAGPCTKQPPSLVRENKPVYDSVRNVSSARHSLLVRLFLISAHGIIPDISSWIPSLISGDIACYLTFHSLLEIGDFCFCITAWISPLMHILMLWPLLSFLSIIVINPNRSLLLWFSTTFTQHVHHPAYGDKKKKS